MPPQAAEAVARYELPAAYDQFCSGGGGRLLIFHFQEPSRLEIFDVHAGRFVHRIDLHEPDVRFAAGMTRLLIALPAGKILQRWDLRTFERDKTVPLGMDGVRKAVMGSDSEGPLLIWNEGPVVLWDIDTMSRLEPKGKVLSGTTRYGFDVRVSRDGSTFVGWTTGLSSQQFRVMTVDGDSVALNSTPDSFSFNERWAIPNADASLLFRFGSGLYGPDLTPRQTASLDGAVLVPSGEPQFLFSVRPAERGQSRLTIHTATDLQPLHTIEDIPSVTSSSLNTRWGYVSGEPRLRFLSRSDLLVALPSGNREIVCRRLSLRDAVLHSKPLTVVSKPRAHAAVGTTYTYRIETIAASTDLTYRLESGPEGMTLADNGTLTWPVTARPLGGIARPIVAISDAAGNEVLHSFEIHVRPATLVADRDLRDAGPADPGEPPGSPETPGAPASPGVSRDRLLELSTDTGFPVRNAAGTHFLLLQGRDLWTLQPDGITVHSRTTLEKTHTRLIERNDYYVAIANEPQSIDVIDRKTLKVVRSRKLSFMSLLDLAAHPTLPICYVAYKGGVEIPRHRFIVFHETTGEATEDNDFIGNWLRVSPDGRFLISAYRDTYEKGARLITNPTRWHVVPEYGSIDWLIRYDLRRDGRPEFAELKEDAGGNGKGLRMAADGSRVTYLSHVGYPRYSGNLGGWRTDDLSSLPVTYATKDRASTYDLAFHPVLPLVASPGTSSAVFFHRETGELQDNRLLSVPESLAQGTIQRVYFSPDGLHLVFDFHVNNVRYLTAARLRLSPAEEKTVTSTQPTTADARPGHSGDRRIPPPANVPLKRLTALRGGSGRPMTPREIASESMPSVVIVSHDRSFGTGFVVGGEGYILTSAHCLTTNGDNFVRYRTSADEDHQRVPAQILGIDDERDLALIKVDATLPAVRLGFGHNVAAGETVCIIGNPGIGELILDNTVTEGNVSSPDRTIGTHRFIQTSASVNPGCSGGPMFNDHGFVVGIVVRKADIEGTGFGVHCDDIADFLFDTASVTDEDCQILRTWTFTGGDSPLEAVFAGMQEDASVLLRNGEELRQVDVARLSPPDRKFVRQVTAQRNSNRRLDSD